METDKIVKRLLDRAIFDGEAEDTIFLISHPPADKILAVDWIAFWPGFGGNLGMQILDIVPEPAR